MATTAGIWTIVTFMEGRNSIVHTERGFMRVKVEDFEYFLTSWIVLACPWSARQEIYGSFLQSVARSGTKMMHGTFLLTNCNGFSRLAKKANWKLEMNGNIHFPRQFSEFAIIAITATRKITMTDEIFSGYDNE